MATKRDILDTNAMLQRLSGVLYDALPGHVEPSAFVVACDDAKALRRISMTLRRWHELECGDGKQHGSWAIVRGFKSKAPDLPSGYAFHRDDDGTPLMEHHHYRHGNGKDTVSYTLLPDRERGALRRLKSIMVRYPALTAYVQTDPRGCALYILRPGDVPAGEDVSAYYSRGLAVQR